MGLELGALQLRGMDAEPCLTALLDRVAVVRCQTGLSVRRRCPTRLSVGQCYQTERLYCADTHACRGVLSERALRQAALSDRAPVLGSAVRQGSRGVLPRQSLWKHPP